MTAQRDEGALVDPNSSTDSGVDVHDSREVASGGTSRRTFLTMGASAAILSGFASKLRAQGPSLAPPPGNLELLVDRTTYGWTPAIWAHAQAIGYDAFLEEQLAYELIDDSALSTMLAAFPTLTMTSKQLYDTYVFPGNQQVPVGELEVATVLRAAYTNRQLYERMVEFWSDHFNVDHVDGQVQWLKTTEDRDVIRAHAMGRFQDLLIADAKSAAMLYYLDNYRNFAVAPNENYAREVMELHTLGVGNYTEADVIAVARCLTGWQYFAQNNPNHGNFFFNAAQHDNGTKTVLGQVFQPNGVAEGEAVLTMLANHFTTAHFICGKMCRWLLTYDPPPLVVSACARVFLGTGGDIRATVRRILRSDTPRIAPFIAPKIKRPFHLMASVIRTCNPTITNPARLLSELATMGHAPMRWNAPNGYPDTADVWGAALMSRWNFLARLTANLVNGVTVPVDVLFAGVPKSGLAAHANAFLTGGRIDSADEAAVQAYANAAPALNNALRRDVLGLMCSAPGFQLY